MKCSICETVQNNGLYFQGDFFCNFCLVTALDATDFYITTLNELIVIYQNLVSSLLEKLERQAALSKEEQAEQLAKAKDFVNEIANMKKNIYDKFN